jgi:RAT1-interacting protein
MVRGKPNAWDPMVCLAYGGEVLSFIKEKVLAVDLGKTGDEDKKKDAEADEGPEPRIWRVMFEVGKGVKMRRLDGQEGKKVRDGRADVDGGRWGFLPGWVRDWRKEGS